MLLNGDHNFAHNAPAAPAAAVASAACDADPSAPSSLDSNPNSQIQNPKSSARRAVPTTFNPIINDEANILAAIARGDRTLPDLAEAYGTTVSNFAVWLQREDIQKKLADLTSAGATLTRIAAVNHLPKAVSAMSFQIDGYIDDRCRNLIKPGLDADRVAALRDANVRKASHLLLRLARFDPSQPVYRRRERADRGNLSEARSPGPDGGAVERAHARETEGALVFSTAFPTALTTAALLSSTSDFPLPTSNIPLPARVSSSDSLPSTSPKGEVSPKATEGALAFPTSSTSSDSSILNSAPSAPSTPHSSSSPTSDIPLPTSDIRHPTSDIPRPTLSTLLDSLESLTNDELRSAVQRGEIDTDVLLVAAGLSGPAP